MNDYIKQLEDQNEHLKQRLAWYEPIWRSGPHPGQAQVVVGRCVLGQYFSPMFTGGKWNGIVFMTLDDVSKYEEASFDTEADVKQWVAGRIYGQLQ